MQVNDNTDAISKEEKSGRYHECQKNFRSANRSTSVIQKLIVSSYVSLECQ